MEENIQNKTSSKNIVISVIIIVVALAIVYTLMRSGQSFGGAEQEDTMSDQQNSTEQFGPQSNSDDLNSIEADLNASSYADLDPNAQ